MARPKQHGALSIRAPLSASVTPKSSAHASAYPPEDEGVDSRKTGIFPFLILPAELRNKIYAMIFSIVPQVIDLDPETFSLISRTKLLAIFAVSRQVYREASHSFFRMHTFRLFPTYPGRYLKTKKPLLARLYKNSRALITTLQLRLGPGWNDPPRGWVVNDALGLADCVNVRVLKIFVDCDPSEDFYKGFRAGEGFYERFSADLLNGVLREIPTIEVVEFDAYSHIKRTGGMMSGLRDAVAKYDKVTTWGPVAKWADEDPHVLLDAVPLNGDPERKAINTSLVLQKLLHSAS